MNCIAHRILLRQILNYDDTAAKLHLALLLCQYRFHARLSLFPRGLRIGLETGTAGGHNNGGDRMI
jgi:hypothetical protein